MFDGSMDASTYTRFLVGLDEGEPEALHALPAADLSGEWAEGLTPASLAEACGVPDCDWSLTVNATLVRTGGGLLHRGPSPPSRRLSRPKQNASHACLRRGRVDRTRSAAALESARKSGPTFLRDSPGWPASSDCVGWAGFTYTVDTLAFYYVHSRRRLGTPERPGRRPRETTPSASAREASTAPTTCRTRSKPPGNLLCAVCGPGGSRPLRQRHSMKLVADLRVSTETQAVDGLGLDVQRKGIRQWCVRMGTASVSGPLTRECPVVQRTRHADAGLLDAFLEWS